MEKKERSGREKEKEKGRALNKINKAFSEGKGLLRYTVN